MDNIGYADYAKDIVYYKKLAHQIYHQFCRPNNMQLDKAVEAGMIPKKDLIKGAKYIGVCRNADQAVWDGKKFIYLRTKFGSKFHEDIPHPEDDEGYDVFVPVRKL